MTASGLSIASTHSEKRGVHTFPGAMEFTRTLLVALAAAAAAAEGIKKTELKSSRFTKSAASHKKSSQGAQTHSSIASALVNAVTAPLVAAYVTAFSWPK